jgi:hypothetical protein
MINDENIPRIKDLIIKLNQVARERKEAIDNLWILATQNEPEQFKSCVDKLWELEDTGEHLRHELMFLLD